MGTKTSLCCGWGEYREGKAQQRRYCGVVAAELHPIVCQRQRVQHMERRDQCSGSKLHWSCIPGRASCSFGGRRAALHPSLKLLMVGATEVTSNLGFRLARDTKLLFVTNFRTILGWDFFSILHTTPKSIFHQRHASGSLAYSDCILLQCSNLQMAVDYALAMPHILFPFEFTLLVYSISYNFTLLSTWRKKKNKKKNNEHYHQDLKHCCSQR